MADWVGAVVSAVDVLAVPAGMTQVSKEEFFKDLMAEARNVHPASEKFSTDWMLVGTKNRWGWSSRGSCGPFDYRGAPPEIFARCKGEGA